MSKLILLNPTVLGLLSPRMVQPGTVFDTVTQATDVTNLVASGGVLVPQTNPVVAAAAVLAQSRRVNKGSNEQELFALMGASAVAVYDAMSLAQATQAGALAEVNAFSLAGGGTIVGAYFLSNTTTAYTAGNKQVYTLNIYDATGTLVGTLASGTNGDGVAAQQMTARVRFSFGAITNGIFGDGYTVTIATALTGTAAIPTGQWILVTKPTF